jgi:hypothetical protein
MEHSVSISNILYSFLAIDVIVVRSIKFILFKLDICLGTMYTYVFILSYFIMYYKFMVTLIYSL